ncbi:MAG TPA: hypothetical protein VF702_03915 [Allosphingosinicella sp.]|jgi:hypothetical protein
MTIASKPKGIGLLFVHGIGEQKRWEHLHSSVLQLAELLRQSDLVASVTIQDDTGAWKAAADEPDFQRAPLTMDVRRADGQKLRFECYEVWWADLGCRSGPLDTLRFWLWGLGQWCAPIYRELDASRLALRPPEERPLSKLPDSVVGRPLEIWVRLQLFAAALAAAFVFCTWSLAKRVFATLRGKTPSPTLIVQYVGDVRTFTERAAPGDSALSDPGFPRRVGIRRRMVREMVALASRKDIGSWYVLAHSLGTVVAYNGLTEIGHALPNYLTEKQWGQVPDAWKRDEQTGKRNADDTDQMMPARPLWLAHDDVINRNLLFKKLRGFLTYGSPLDKFAGLWPRIVATATDRANPFQRAMRWVNLYAPTDPVAGPSDSYGQIPLGLPAPRNCRARWSIWAGLEHIRYFRGFERFQKAEEGQRIAVGEWLLGESADDIELRDAGAGTARFAASAWYLVLIVLLWVVTASLIVLAARALSQAAGEDRQSFFDWTALEAGLRTALGPVAGLFVALVLVIGLYRWMRESWLNWTLAAADELGEAAIAMLRRNAVAATLLLMLMVPPMIAALFHDLALAAEWADRLPSLPIKELLPESWAASRWVEGLLSHGWITAVAGLLGIGFASAVQALVNAADP